MRPLALSGERALGWLPSAGALLFGWFCLWNKLRVDWTINEQYQYGWFVPPLAAALLVLRWKDRPEPRTILPGLRWTLGLATLAGLCLILPIRLMEGPNPDWRLLYWMHASVLVVLSLALASWCGGWPWARHFAFPVLFLLVAIPWPSEPEQAVVQSLMRGAAGIAAECMAILGIPAVAQGNVISVHGQTVGVNEACSGIRSLQTTLMAGLFLGELSRFRVGRRAALLVGGVLMALLANVFRSSFLVWIAARSGLAALERYHDATGLTVLVIVFGALLGLNSLLSKNHRGAPLTDGGDRGFASPVVPPRWAMLAVLFWLGTVEVGNAWWYGAPGTQALVGLPRWTVSPPADAPDFQSLPIDERTAEMLRYDHAMSMRWTRLPPDRPGVHDDCALFFFRWDPGHASSLQAGMHQPHICLTASGLTMTADWGIHPWKLPSGLVLPVRRYEFDARGREMYVFFVVWQDGVSGADEPEEVGSRAARLRAVLERRPIVGRQTLEFLVSGPASPEEANALFEQEMTAVVRREN